MVPIATDTDLIAARAQARVIALQLGFSKTDATLIATAISEIARNILVHAGNGELLLRSVSTDERQGPR